MRRSRRAEARSSGLRRPRALLLGATVALAVALTAPAAASAAISQVFTTTPTPVSCALQASGQRWCGSTNINIGQVTRVGTWDAVPIDVSVTFPPATGSDTNYPVVGVFHGWGGQKLQPSSATVQRWVNQGYAVFSMTDRGWWGSCGLAAFRTAGICDKGYIRLMHNAYEVRDAQYLLGKLADQGVIDPQRIGATGGSYGGGISVQLGALKDRVQLPDGSLIQWQSPNGTPMKIAATAPEFPWTDLSQSLQPNGSGLDYVADAPYLGAAGDRRFGIQKQNWNASLFNAPLLGIGFYAPTSGPGYPDPTANLVTWNAFNSTGGPYEDASGTLLPTGAQQVAELPNHGAYYTDLSQAPAPALLSSGWNDDLFPVDETVRYYNKVRSRHPGAAIKMFHLDFGHNPRAATITATNAGKLQAAEDVWFAKYVKGTGATPAAAQGGVDAITSACPTGSSGTQYTAADWADLAPGEIRLDGAAAQTIVAPGTAPANPFTSGTICTTQAAGDNASAATYKLDPAPAGGFTIAGSPTVVADLTTAGANDMIAARLYDVDPADGQILLARGLYRPTGVGAGPTRQVFQLHPQAWKVPAGHIVKLELLSQDSTYARLAPGRQSIQVQNLQLRLPTVDAPGAAGGLVQEPLPKVLPPGYRLARDVRTTVPGSPYLSSGLNPNATGIFGLAWTASDPATDLRYGLQHRSAAGGWGDVDAEATTNAYAFTAASPEGEGTWNYRVNAHEADGDPATAYSPDSAPIKVDKSAPAAPAAAADREPEDATGGWFKDTVTVTFTAPGGDPDLTDGSPGSGVDAGSLQGPFNHDASGTFTDTSTAKDAVGNESGATSLTTKVDATDPELTVSCPAAVLLGASAAATVAASDGESGLVSDPSGSVTIRTDAVGPKIVTRTVRDRVGHEVTRSCTTQVQYMFSGLLQPVNVDGSSIFKLGSTVPLKFRLTDLNAALVSGAFATVDVAKVTEDVEGTYVEAVSTAAATTGNQFRESSGQYVFNLATKGLSAGTWSIRVTLDDGTTYKTHVSLR